MRVEQDGFDKHLRSRLVSLPPCVKGTRCVFVERVLKLRNPLASNVLSFLLPSRSSSDLNPVSACWLGFEHPIKLAIKLHRTKMFVKRVSLLALASLVLAQEHMDGMSGSEHNTAAAAAETMAPTDSEIISATPYMSDYPSGGTDYVSTAVDTMETTLPETMAPASTNMSMAPTSDEASAPTTMDYSMTTSVVPDPSAHHGMGGMPMPSGGMPMPMPNGTASPEPPISGSAVSGVSVSSSSGTLPMFGANVKP